MTLTARARFVVDASVAIKWVVAEPGAEQALRLLDHALVAPDLLFVECANILWRKVRLEELSPAEAAFDAQVLERAGLAVVSTRGYMTRAVTIAVELDHPAYDAVYLAVAEALGVRLVTADDRLIRKLRQPPMTFSHLAIPLSEITGGEASVGS